MAGAKGEACRRGKRAPAESDEPRLRRTRATSNAPTVIDGKKKEIGLALPMRPVIFGRRKGFRASADNRPPASPGNAQAAPR